MLKNPLKTLLDALINRFTKERLETLILTADEKLLTFMLEDKNANDYKNAFLKRSLIRLYSIKKRYWNV
ncbi:hypothetical protein VN0244_15280 [Helicobacter pylori]|nr:hypothetical protein VN0244_15280 [Helicobacter pylori]